MNLFGIKMSTIQLLQFITACLSEFNVKVVYLSGQRVIKFMFIIENNFYLLLNVHTSNKNINSLEDIFNSEYRSQRSFRFDLDEMYLFYQKSEDSEEILVDDSLKINLISKDIEHVYPIIMKHINYLNIISKDITEIPDSFHL